MANVNLASVVLRTALRAKIGTRQSHDMITQKIGKREVVGHGWNGLPVYADRVDYPMPAIRFKENTRDVLVSAPGLRVRICFLSLINLFRV